MQISKWKVPDFFLKLIFTLLKLLKHGVSLFSYHYANEEKFWTQYGLSSRKQPPRLDILGGPLREVMLTHAIIQESGNKPRFLEC